MSSIAGSAASLMHFARLSRCSTPHASTGRSKAVTIGSAAVTSDMAHAVVAAERFMWFQLHGRGLGTLTRRSAPVSCQRRVKVLGGM